MALTTPSSLVAFVLEHARLITGLCTRQKWETGYALQPRTVADYNFIYVTRGRVVWEIAGQPHELRPGGLALVPPGVSHRGWSETRRVTFVSVHVEVALPGGQDAFRLLVPPQFVQVPAGSRLDAYLRGALAEFDRADEREVRLMLPGWARLITLEFIRLGAQRGLLTPRALDPVVAGLLDELPRRLMEPVSLNELADRAGYSPQHLNRIFRRELGVTPLKHLMRLRLERAAALLAEGRLTVAAVARSLGFADAAYFARAFKARYGLSSRRYQATAGSESPS